MSNSHNVCEYQPEGEKLDEFKAQAEEVATMMSSYLEAFVSTLDNHPELTERLGEVICRYIDVFMPATRKANQMVIEERKKAFKEFKAMGLSDELAAKMVCGR